MTPEQRTAVEKAAAILKQARELDEQAWKVLEPFALQPKQPDGKNADGSTCDLLTDAMVDALDVALDGVRDDPDTVSDDPAFRATALIDWWELEEEEEREGAKQVCAQCGEPLVGPGKVIGCHGCDATLCSHECLDSHLGKAGMLHANS